MDAKTRTSRTTCPHVRQALEGLPPDEQEWLGFHLTMEVKAPGMMMDEEQGGRWLPPRLERVYQMMLWSVRRERGVRPYGSKGKRPVSRARRGGGRPKGRRVVRRADATRGSPDDGEPGSIRTAVLGMGRWS